MTIFIILLGLSCGLSLFFTCMVLNLRELEKIENNQDNNDEHHIKTEDRQDNKEKKEDHMNEENREYVSNLNRDKVRLKKLKSKLENKYVKISGKISEIESKIEKLENQLQYKIDTYEKGLKDLKNNIDNGLTKQQLKNKKEIINKNKELLENNKNSLYELEYSKNEIEIGIETIDLRLYEIEEVVNFIVSNDNYSTINSSKKLEKINNKIKGEIKATKELLNFNGYKSNENAENISLSELEL